MTKLVSHRRFEPHHDLLNPLVLERDHPSIVEGRTLFPSSVRDPSPGEWVLKSGANQYKLGDRVTRGRAGLKGAPIFSLSLEERSSCPECSLWLSCYGNHSPFSLRYRHGPKLIRQLQAELELLQLRHPGGFLIRLHQLGDFYSVEYVRQWAKEWLDEFPALHVFGYTHHRPNETEIGRELARWINTRWSRFAVRWSNWEGSPKSTRTLTTIPKTATVRGAVVCPQQHRRTDLTCGSCTACWTSSKPIAFVIH